MEDRGSKLTGCFRFLKKFCSNLDISYQRKEKKRKEKKREEKRRKEKKRKEKKRKKNIYIYFSFLFFDTKYTSLNRIYKFEYIYIYISVAFSSVYSLQISRAFSVILTNNFHFYTLQVLEFLWKEVLHNSVLVEQMV